MPDFLAGQTLTPLHFPPTVTNFQAGSFTFNATTFGTDNDSGTYVDCGVSFVACATGRAMVLFGGSTDNSTAGAFTIMAPVIRTGGTVGSGTVFLAASDDEALSVGDVIAMRLGAPPVLLTGLTSGDTYNVRLEHRVSAGVGTLLRRRVTVAPCT